MANLNQMLDHVAKLPRSGFDMSQKFAFTASTGMLLPVYSDLLTSSETVYIKEDFIARTQPLVTATIAADVDFYLDWFFVPMTMLYTPWGQVRWQTTDFVSGVFDSKAYNEAGFTDSSKFPQFQFVNSFTFLKTASDLTQGAPAYLNRSSTVSFSQADFETIGKSMFRLADFFGYNPISVFSGLTSTQPSSGQYFTPNVFPWKALAYQCIYQNWYRNDDLEPRNVACYNCDKFFNEAPSSYFFPATSALHPLVLRYADYRKDYFTSAKPNPIMSSVSSLVSDSESEITLGTVLNSVDNYLSSNAVGSYNSSNTPVGITSNFTQEGIILSQVSSSPRLTTGGIRSLFAVEKLLRIVGRANKDYDSQTLAHFGFKVPHDVKHQITHLRSNHGLLQIGDVVSTANTFDGSSGSALGELGGKGYAGIHSNGKPTKFTAPVDGALMCIFRAIPRQRIVGAFDKQNSIVSRTDLFIPEFDKLGMQPLYTYEFNSVEMGTSAFNWWQLRYQQYKQKYDRASFVFSRYAVNSSSVNQYSPWVLSRQGLTSSISLFTSSKCPPTALNSMMVVPYTTQVPSLMISGGNYAAMYYTDPFICDFEASVKKVSPMSPSGEPDMVSF